MLILDIFAQRAQSREGKLQVELAQQQYRLSRLVGHGPVAVPAGRRHRHARPRRDPSWKATGATSTAASTLLKRNLAEVAEQRERTRLQRRENEVLTLAVVGYTNAGKSTLINRLCQTSLSDGRPGFRDPRSGRSPHASAGPGRCAADRYGRLYPQAAASAGRCLPLDAGGSDRCRRHPAGDRCVGSGRRHADGGRRRLAGPSGCSRQTAFVGFQQDGPAAGRSNQADPDQVDQDPTGLIRHLTAALPTGQRQQAFLVSALTGDGIGSLVQAIGDLAARSQLAANLLIPYTEAGLLDYIRQHGHLDSWNTCRRAF